LRHAVTSLILMLISNAECFYNSQLEFLLLSQYVVGIKHAN